MKLITLASDSDADWSRDDSSSDTAAAGSSLVGDEWASRRAQQLLHADIERREVHLATGDSKLEAVSVVWIVPERLSSPTWTMRLN
jgi:hypothetical protein